jgi:hypothetical protein
MAATDPEQSSVPPIETSGGTSPDAEEVARKGEWAGRAAKGIVPRADSSVFGRTTGSDEPATETGVDLSAGDNADATSHGGPNLPDDPNVEPDLKDGAAKPVR